MPAAAVVARVHVPVLREAVQRALDARAALGGAHRRPALRLQTLRPPLRPPDLGRPPRQDAPPRGDHRGRHHGLQGLNKGWTDLELGDLVIGAFGWKEKGSLSAAVNAFAL